MRAIARMYSADTVVTPTASAHMVILLKLLGSTIVTPTAEAVVKGVATLRGSTSTLQGASENSIAEAIWGSLAASFNAAGTMGEKINDAGSGGDPWATATSTYTTPGTFGYLVQKLLTVAKFIGLK